MTSLTQVENCVDVLVVGGGTAGSMAALQAARAGASTMLVEMGPQLGGVTTTGGVSFPGLFHAWGRQIIRGIGWELVAATVAMEDRTLPDFTVVPKAHWHHQVRINGQLYAALLEEAAIAAGVQLRYYEMPVQIDDAGDRWAVQMVGKQLHHRVTCRQLIDATGDADCVAMMGLPRQRESQTQPGTLIFRLEGYDPQLLDAPLIQQRYEQALNSGALQPGDHASKARAFLAFLRSGGENAQHVFDADSSTSATRTQANIAGRASLLRLLRFIRSLPGCEKARIASCQSETAVRETWRIEGEVCISAEDYCQGRAWEDAVCYAFYPIDLHDRDGVRPQPLAPGVVAQVPLRALIPAHSHRLLVAGRCVSSDRQANSALRVQATCMAMGQAAGAVAALAAGADLKHPGQVAFREIVNLLEAHGAIVPASDQGHKAVGWVGGPARRSDA